ncbi:MAG: hypothetical protein V1884_04380 [Candidatus Omnitrophota bacterium]
MRKRSLGLVLVLTLTLLIAECFAEEESYTITTYYPSPYGSYNQLQVYRSVQYKPVDNVGNLPNPQEGELVYDSSKDALYLFNGQRWVAQGGGAPLMSLKCSWTTAGASAGSCNPPACSSDWIQGGVGCASTGAGMAAYAIVPSGVTSGASSVTQLAYYTVGYCERWCYKQ